MTLDEQVRAVVLDAMRDALSTLRTELERPRMLKIKEAPIAYRAILAAERRGELQIFRVGHSALLDESELYAWVRRFGVARAPVPVPAVHDEIGELIALDNERRAKRQRRAK